MKTALLSVYDKTGIENLARELVELGYQIISSGGTAKALKAVNIPCREVWEYTGFPEVLDGRVKTLHPKIHAGILAKRDSAIHMTTLDSHQMSTIDLVAVNLYPFEAASAKHEKTMSGKIPEDVIENIDIGGPAMIRSAAKNHKDVLVVVNPADYPAIIDGLKNNEIDYEFRRKLMAKAFAHTAHYDSLIAHTVSTEKFPEQLTVPYSGKREARYGENPHQEAAVYTDSRYAENKSAAAFAKQIQGKPMSSNNIADVNAAWITANEFPHGLIDGAFCNIVKHGNPCGFANARTMLEAYQKAYAVDPDSAFGGVIAFTKPVDYETAYEIVETNKHFVECIIAPQFHAEAQRLFGKKPNMRLLWQPSTYVIPRNEMLFEKIAGGAIIQERDNMLYEALPDGLPDLKNVTKRHPTWPEMESLMLAFYLAGHLTSNSLAAVYDGTGVGLGCGQQSRVDSMKTIMERWKKNGFDPKKSTPTVLGSEALFPNPDSIKIAGDLGIRAIIQPGGSIKDNEVIDAANEYDMAMVFTGVRHFKHTRSK